MKTLMTMVLLYIMIMTGVMAQTVQFSAYDESDDEYFFIEVDEKEYFAKGSFGVAEGLGDCVRVEIECDNDLKVSEDAYIKTEIAYNKQFDETIESGEYEEPFFSTTCKSPMIHKERKGDKMELYFGVSDEYLKHWAWCQYTTAFGREPITLTTSIVLTDVDVMLHNMLFWVKDGKPIYNEDRRRMWDEDTSKAHFESKEFKSYDLQLSVDIYGSNYYGTGFNDEFEKLKKMMNYDQYIGITARLFHTEYKSYGSGMKLMVSFPESFVIDASARVKMSVKTKSNETKEVEAKIMSNDKGAICDITPLIGYRHGYCVDGDSVYVCGQYYTSTAEMKRMYEKMETKGKKFAVRHPDISYWKEEMSTYEVWKEKREKYYGYDRMEEDLVDSCVVANETEMYFDLKEEDMDMLKEAKIIERIEIRQDGGEWMVYGKGDEDIIL